MPGSTFEYDVLICGGGLAGLSLARQLQLQPETRQCRLAIVDRYELPGDGRQKVGESTVEAGAHYLAETLQLRNLLETKHLRKNGLRFIPGGGRSLAQRPEIGPLAYPRLPSYQIDRPSFEADLLRLIVEDGADLFTGMIVEDIDLATGGTHRVACRRRNDRASLELRGRWVIDALGRRRFLQQKLGLARPVRHQAGAAWFYVSTAVDLSRLSTDPRWRSSDPDGVRRYSTNHLIGAGYWLWLIPLAGGRTSVGLVFDATHDVAELRDVDRLRGWLRSHEPEVALALERETFHDFKVLKSISYGTARLFHENRWCCTGEAALFLDPFYSYGTDFIAVENSLITEMIRRDVRAEADEDLIPAANDYVLDFADALDAAFVGLYASFNNPRAFPARTYWDTLFYWSCPAAIKIHGWYREPAVLRHTSVRRFFALHREVQGIFHAWTARSAIGGESAGTPAFFPLPARGSYLSDLHGELCGRPPACAEDWLRERLAYAEEVAAVLRRRMQETGDINDPALLRAQTELRYMYGEMDEAHFENVKVLQRTLSQLI